MLPASKMSVPRLCLTVLRREPNRSRARLHVRQNAAHCREVGARCDRRVSGALEHLRQVRGQRSNGPADGVAVGDRVHAVKLADTDARALGATQHRGRGDVEIGIFRAVDVAFLDVEAVEPEQAGFPPVDIGSHDDGDTLVGVILNVAVPEFVFDDERQGIGGKSVPLRGLRHVWTFLP
jgi:hypothetical protein